MNSEEPSVLSTNLRLRLYNIYLAKLALPIVENVSSQIPNMSRDDIRFIYRDIICSPTSLSVYDPSSYTPGSHIVIKWVRLPDLHSPVNVQRMLDDFLLVYEEYKLLISFTDKCVSFASRMYDGNYLYTVMKQLLPKELFVSSYVSSHAMPVKAIEEVTMFKKNNEHYLKRVNNYVFLGSVL